MKKYTFLVVLCVVTVATGVVVAKLNGNRTRSADRPSIVGSTALVPVNEYSVSGPYTHQNLTVFLVHGDESFRGKPLLTLPEAMERKVVVVRETKAVNELAIENVSRGSEVFVQAGDIVKGGQQDRVLSTDLLVSARSGRMPIDAFCVEHGRWNKRGSEPSATFGGGGVATKDVKLAAKQARSQGQVWGKVDAAQRKMSASVRTEVKANDSPTSLQLSLENPKVRESADAYVKALSSIITERPDVIGYIFAVNGKVNSADVYSSRALFRKLWPRLLNASAEEAVTELATFDKATSLSLDGVREFFANAEKGTPSERNVTKRTKVFVREAEQVVFFETRDMENNASWVHRNYLAK
jgi:hypothetical protein